MFFLRIVAGHCALSHILTLLTTLALELTDHGMVTRASVAAGHRELIDVISPGSDKMSGGGLAA